MNPKNEYSIEGLAHDRYNIYYRLPKGQRNLICVAASEPIARVIVIALMEIDKNRGIHWNNL